MTETAPDHDRRKASTEPGLEGEGDQYDEGAHSHADGEERAARAAVEADDAEGREP